MSDNNKTEALVRLASGISHELNNIFMVIDGNLSLIYEDENLPRSIKEVIAECLAASRRGISLSRNLQAYAGRQALQPAVIDLRSIVRKVADAIQRECLDIEVRLCLPVRACTVRIDPQRAEAALFELTQNARAAMSAGGTLTFEVRRGDPHQLEEDARWSGPDNTVRLTILDDGIGLSSEARLHATEPMFTDKENAGSRAGWGLSIVEGFIRQSGGTLSLSTADNGGTCVDIYLPAAWSTLQES